MQQYVNQSNLEKHLIFFITRFKIALQTSKEYKSNLYSHILNDLVITITYMIFFKIVLGLIGNNLNWSYFDFWIYFLLLGIAAKSMYNFTLRKFSKILLTGDFNTVQLHPINRFLNSITKRITGHSTITTFNFVIILIISIIFKSESYILINIILATLFFIFATIYFYMYINFFESFAFFFKNIEQTVRFANNQVNYINEFYTPKVFESSKFKDFFYLLPSALYGYLTIEILKGNYFLSLHYLYYAIIIFVIFCVSISILWKFGLKKYEAFG